LKELVRSMEPFENLRGFLLYIVGELISGMPGDTVSADNLDLLNHCADTLYQCDTVVEVRVATMDLLRRIRGVLTSERRSPGERIVRELMEIMNRRLDQRVTINELSKIVFLTPQYMCTLFKQHTRMTIYEYITGQRVNRAKELLRGDTYKLYEIAAMVGYQDVKSFAKVFKRATGVAPSEYAQS
nr:AraC family transcriptional regulator [Clostridia bacterium]